MGNIVVITAVVTLTLAHNISIWVDSLCSNNNHVFQEVCVDLEQKQVIMKQHQAGQT